MYEDFYSSSVSTRLVRFCIKCFYCKANRMLEIKQGYMK